MFVLSEFHEVPMFLASAIPVAEPMSALLEQHCARIFPVDS